MTATDAPRPGTEDSAGTPPTGSPVLQRRDPRALRPRPAGAPRTRAPRREASDPVVDCAVYVDGHRQPAVDPRDALKVAREADGFVWLGLYEPTESELAVYADEYNLHPLAV